MDENAKSARIIDAHLFEDKFIFWNKLPIHFKIDVLRTLPYPTLRNFTFLSKECMALSLKAKSSVYGVFLQHMPYKIYGPEDVSYENCTASVTVYYMPPGTVGPDLHKKYTIFFDSITDRECIARREKKGRKIVRVGPKYAESCYVVSMRVFFNVLKYINPEQVSVEIGLVKSEVKYLIEELQSQVSLNCDRFTVTAFPLDFLTPLIRRVTPGCKLRIYDSHPFGEPEAACITSDVFDSETIRMAPSIDTNVLCEVSDEQFVSLRAHTIFMIAPRLSAKGINGVILQWIDGKREIARIHLTAMEGLDRKMVFENVDSANILSESEIQKSPSLKEYAESCFDGGMAGVVGIRNKSGVILLNISSAVCELVDPHSDAD